MKKGQPHLSVVYDKRERVKACLSSCGKVVADSAHSEARTRDPHLPMRKVGGTPKTSENSLRGLEGNSTIRES